jgi:pilus assembly protein CpaD
MRAASAALSLSLIALAGCVSNSANVEPGPRTPTERYAIQVSQAPLELKLAPHADGLSRTQVDALRDFAGRWLGAEGGMITVKSPAHGPGPDDAYRTATSARDVLVESGVEPAKVRVVGYDADGDNTAPIVVSFVRYVATGPQCGQWPNNLNRDPDNNGYPQFGCSMAANLAAEIANPADLVGPRASTPPDATRRQVEIEKYRQGQTTSTTKDPQADGSFSNVGGQ